VKNSIVFQKGDHDLFYPAHGSQTGARAVTLAQRPWNRLYRSG